jgi:hypothetical protein
MPDMPMPPMPTKWIGPSWVGSFVAAAFMRVLPSGLRALDQRDKRSVASGTDTRQRGLGHAHRGVGLVRMARIVAARTSGVSLLSGISAAASASTRPRALAVCSSRTAAA